MKTSEYLVNYGIQWLGHFTATATGVVFALFVAGMLARVYIRSELDSIKANSPVPQGVKDGSTPSPTLKYLLSDLPTLKKDKE